MEVIQGSILQTAVYKLYQKAADDIARSGGRVTRLVLDFELKRSLNRQFARTAGMSPEEQARRKQEIAEEHGLKVIDGRVVIPDLRLEYETPDHEQSRVDSGGCDWQLSERRPFPQGPGWLPHVCPGPPPNRVSTPYHPPPNHP